MDYKYFIKKIDHPTEDSIILDLSNKNGRPVFDYRPGQYVMITYRNERGVIMDKHAFSLASSPTNWDHIQLGIKIHGKFTQGLAKLTAGEEVFVSGPFGNFTFNEKKHHDLVMIAGGIGITPFLSTIKYAADKHLPNRMTLLYSNRTLSGSLFRKDLKSLEKQNGNFRSLLCLTAPETRVNLQGVVYQKIDTRLLNDYLGPLTRKTFFICGPLGFMSGMKENLLLLGADQNQIEMEEFSMIPATGFWAGVKNVSYAVSLSGLLLIAPLGLIYNSSAKTADGKPPVRSILSADFYNTEKFYRLARKTYDQILAEKQIGTPIAQPVLAAMNDFPARSGVLPLAADIATDSASSVPAIINNPAKELIKAIAKVFNSDLPPLNKVGGVKKFAVADTKKTAPVVKAPKAAPSVDPKISATAAKTVKAPTPVTSASVAAAEAAAATNPAAITANPVLTAPAPTTAASGAAPAVSAPTTAAPAASAPSQTTTTPAPTTAASAPAGSTSSGSTPTTVTNPPPTTTTGRNRNEEEDDD